MLSFLYGRGKTATSDRRRHNSKFISMLLVAVAAGALALSYPSPSYACGSCGDGGKGGYGGKGGHKGGQRGGKGGHKGGHHGSKGGHKGGKGGHKGGHHAGKGGGGYHAGKGGRHGGKRGGKGGYDNRGDDYFERMQKETYYAYAGRKKYTYEGRRKHFSLRGSYAYRERLNYADTVYAPVYTRVIRPRHVKVYRPLYRTHDATFGGHFPAEVLTAPAYSYSSSISEPVYDSEIIGYEPVAVRRVIRPYRSSSAYESGYPAYPRHGGVSGGYARITGGLPRYDSNEITYLDGAHNTRTVYADSRARYRKARRGGYRSSYRSGRHILPSEVTVQEIYSLPGRQPSSHTRVRCIDADGCY